MSAIEGKSEKACFWAEGEGSGLLALKIPSEIILQILLYVNRRDLGSLAQTNRFWCNWSLFAEKERQKTLFFRFEAKIENFIDPSIYCARPLSLLDKAENLKQIDRFKDLVNVSCVTFFLSLPVNQLKELKKNYFVDFQGDGYGKALRIALACQQMQRVSSLPHYQRDMKRYKICEKLLLYGDFQRARSFAREIESEEEQISFLQKMAALQVEKNQIFRAIETIDAGPDAKRNEMIQNVAEMTLWRDPAAPSLQLIRYIAEPKSRARAFREAVAILVRKNLLSQSIKAVEETVWIGEKNEIWRYLAEVAVRFNHFEAALEMVEKISDPFFQTSLFQAVALGYIKEEKIIEGLFLIEQKTFLQKRSFALFEAAQILLKKQRSQAVLLEIVSRLEKKHLYWKWDFLLMDVARYFQSPDWVFSLYEADKLDEALRIVDEKLDDLAKIEALQGVVKSLKSLGYFDKAAEIASRTGCMNFDSCFVL